MALGNRTPYSAEIEAVADSHGLSPIIVEAIVLVESSGHTDAFRFEPQFWARYHLGDHPIYGKMNPRRCSSSYGLMQCLFPVAYELGFREEPELLFLPDVGLEWGCRKLASNLAWASGLSGDAEKVLWAAVAAYNGGRGGNRPTDAPLRNVLYAAKVRRVVAR